MNKKKARKLSLNRETLHRMEEVELARVAGAAFVRESGDTDVTVCPTREWSSCCPPTGAVES